MKFQKINWLLFLLFFIVVFASGCAKVNKQNNLNNVVKNLEQGKDTKLKNNESISFSGINIKFLGIEINKNGLGGQEEYFITCPLELTWRDQRDTLHLKEGESMEDFGLDLTVKKCNGKVDSNSYVTISVVDRVDPKLRANPNYCQFTFDCEYLKCENPNNEKPGKYPVCKNNECVCGCGDITNNFTCE